MSEEEEYERYRSIYSMHTYHELWEPLKKIYVDMGYIPLKPEKIYETITVLKRSV
jgi:hypothetical protein